MAQKRYRERTKAIKAAESQPLESNSSEDPEEQTRKTRKTRNSQKEPQKEPEKSRQSMPIVIDDPAASSTPEIDKRKSKTSYQRTWCAKLNRQKLQSAREKNENVKKMKKKLPSRDH